MEADSVEAIALMKPEAAVADRDTVERLLALRDAAWLLAVRVLGGPAGAEDAVQQAYLDAWRHLLAEGPPAGLRTWFLRVVANAAKMQRRAELRRRAREAAVKSEKPSVPGYAPDAERIEAVRREMDNLDEQYRVPVSLCCEQGLTQQEAAEVLELSQSAVSRQVGEGLERLRRALAAAGYSAAATSAVAAMLAGAPKTAAPASLAAAIEKIFSGGAMVKGTGTATATALKGGLVMKIGLGVAAVGLVAGGAFWAVGGKSEESGKPPEPKAPSAVEVPPEPKSKFAVPIWSPDARWDLNPEPYIGSGASGSLGGPRLDIMTYCHSSEARCAYDSLGGPYGCTSYDPGTERYHHVAGASRGLMDGPFSRARFGGHDYGRRSFSTASLDGRYFFCVDPYFNKALRRLDLDKQEVKTIPLPDNKLSIAGMVADSQGQLLFVADWTFDKLVYMDFDGKKIKELKLELQQKPAGGWYIYPALDEVHGRLYCTTYGKQVWFIWYWDLKDGSFHGVLPGSESGEPKRKGGTAGPFKGTALYGELGGKGIWFGPDDPEKKFPYLTVNDMMTFFRLDMDKQEIWGCSREKDGLRFVGSEGSRNVFHGDQAWSSHLNGQGDVVASLPGWSFPRLMRFRRVK